MKKTMLTTIIAMIVGAFLMVGCSSTPKEVPSGGTDKAPSSDNKVKVAFSQSQSSDPWRIAMTDDVRRAAKENGYELIYTDAQGDTSKQISDVEDICAQDVDYLIYAPREYEASAAALDIAKEAGVKVVLVDRTVRGEAGSDYITYIGTDFVWEGNEAGKWLVDALNGEGKIVEITGTAGASAAIDRQTGFMTAIDENPGMEVLASQTADFSRSEAQAVMENLLQSYGNEINAVFAHNDEMGLGAIQAIKGAGLVPGKDIIVVSCDGQKDAVQAVIDGELGATVTCNPRYGDITFDILGKIIAGEEIEDIYILEDFVIDLNNAEERLPLAH